MKHEGIILAPQHPACKSCDSQGQAQSTLNALLKAGEPIRSASINCQPENDHHARVIAIANAIRRNPKLQETFILTTAVLFCPRRAIDDQFIPIESIY